MGRTDEQHSSDSRTDSNKGDNLQLEEQSEKEADENASFFNEQTIRKILEESPNIEKNKVEFGNFIYENHKDKEKCKEYIKQILGNAYTEFDVDDKRVGYKVNEDNLNLWLGNYLTRSEECFVDWDTITKYCIVNHVHYAIPKYNKDTYSFMVGDVIHLGLQEFTIISLDNGKMTMYDNQLPLDQRTVVIEDIMSKIAENPLNDYLKDRDIPEQEKENIEENLFDKWLDTFVEEKGIDLGQILEVKTDKNTHYFEVGNIIENIKATTLEEQEKIKNMIIKIDFYNGDVVDYFKHLAQALAQNYEQQMEIEEKMEANEEQEYVTEKIVKKNNNIEYFDLHPEIPPEERNNFRITDDNLGVGTLKEKYRNNIEAIKVLKLCEEQNRYATPEEQEILSRYVGWGGLKSAFEEQNENWANEYIELKEILTEDEYKNARASSVTAYYTPPVVIRNIYKALQNMGLKQANILEPACGIGNFFGMLPEELNNCQMYGVELDSISGRIAQQLYQKSTIAVQAYEKTNIPDNFFDVALGNVPFDDFKPNDRRYNKNKFVLHDYFFAKTLDKVRPDGIIAFVTSKGTMDKENTSVRKYLCQRAELVGAIRLPDNTFKNNAGTEVTSDIIFLKKRDKITDIEEDWVNLDTTENGIKMNKYFVDNPNMIMGQMVMESTRFGESSACKMIEGSDLDYMLSNAISNIQAEIEEYDLDELLDDEANSIPADPTVKNYSYAIIDNKVYYRENSRMYEKDYPETKQNRIKGMVEIRDSVRQLIELQVEDSADNEIQLEQDRLNRLYDNFVKKYGRINSRGNNQAFSEDSSYYLLCSLEILDSKGNFIRKADMFSKRTIKPKKEITKVDTANEALIVSLTEKARIDIEFMQSITDKTEEELVKELEGQIFRLPDTPPEERKYVTADEYLSGNVREKLNIARRIAEHNPEFEINVRELEKVIPEDIKASEIVARLGATWIPEKYIEQFIYELLDTEDYKKREIKVHYSECTSQWNVTGKSVDKGVKATKTYGVKKASAYKIIETTLNLNDIKIYKKINEGTPEEKSIIDKQQTAIAQAKQDEIRMKFEEWIFKNADRREELVKLYNEKFNSIRNREYDGSHLKFYGMNPEIKLRPHQLNAIARILYKGNTLLAHEVRSRQDVRNGG